MSKHASYIFSSYSFIQTLSNEQLLQVGNLAAEGSPIPSFDEDLLINLCQDVVDVFRKEENIIEIDDDVIIVGDIHGSFHDLLRIIRLARSTNSKIIFLGDYVDRGSFSLECITLLFALKTLHPDTYYLLRGNHEFNDMCSQYGFKKEILNFHNPNKIEQTVNEQENVMPENPLNFDIEEKKDEKADNSNEESYYTNHVNINCYKYTEKLYDAFIHAFSFLPISAIINKTSICLHGGLTPLLDKVENIQKLIPRPISSFDENELLSDILWSDPSIGLSTLYGENQRGRGKLFNGAVVVNFLRNNNLKRLIRGHECVNNGVEQLFNDKCITVFSASSYNCEMGNSSGILKIYKKDDKFEPIILPPLRRLKKCDADYYKVQPFEVNHEEGQPLGMATGFRSGVMTRINSAHSDLFLMSHFHTSHRQLSPNRSGSETGLSADIIPKPVLGRRKSNTIVRAMPSLKSGPRRKSGCLKAPFIYTPQISHQNSELPKQLDQNLF